MTAVSLDIDGWHTIVDFNELRNIRSNEAHLISVVTKQFMFEVSAETQYYL